MENTSLEFFYSAMNEYMFRYNHKLSKTVSLFTANCSLWS